MFEVGYSPEMKDIGRNPSEINGFMQIKPEEGTTFETAQVFWDNYFRNEALRDGTNEANVESNLEKCLKDYIKDLKDKSEYPDTIPDKPFDLSDLKKLSPEANAEMRDEFDDSKAQLKREWEVVNGKSWPQYDHDIYSSNGKLIRRAGSDYDAHHIQPLGMGGKNEVSNITPLNAEIHYDKQGVHAFDSPYSKLEQGLGGID